MNRKQRRALGKTAPAAEPAPSADFEALFAVALAHHREGRVGEALAAWDEVVRVRPDHAPSHCNRGVGLIQAGRFDEALGAFDAALRAQPDFANAHSYRGVALDSLGRLEEAVAAQDAALALQPGHAIAHLNRGVALNKLGRPVQAVAAFDAALQLDPQYADAHYNRGIALADACRFDEAVQAYAAATRLDPGHAKAWTNLGNVCKELGRLDEAVQAYEAALKADAGDPDAHSNLIMGLSYFGQRGQAATASALGDFGRRFGQAPAPAGFANTPNPARRLRVGYVSGDLRQHPVGFFLDKVLACHDGAQVEVFCYATEGGADAYTARLKARADHWASLVGLSDAQAAARILADAIDILIDLSGHTAHNRLPMFAHRPAPIQASWLGYWGSTGLPRMDYVLSDATTIPPGAEADYGETVVRLPGLRFCYSAPDFAPEPAPPPVQANGFVTFGSFNQLAKLGPDVVSLWAQVLRAVPGSRLLLKWKSLEAQSARARLAEAFSAEGVEPGRLIFQGHAAHARMLAAYGQMDIALDPFPFCGGATSCEALWMGVPVITLPGPEAQSCQTLGFLKAIGLEELAATSREDYVRVAAELAGDTERLSDLRRTLRPRMAASSLCDGPAFTHGLERVYRRLWRDWLAHQRATAQAEE